MKRLAALVGSLVAAFMVLVPLAAHPALALTCGDHVTSDTTLTADLSGCGSSGLVIDADHITIDLNGYSITGTGGPGSDGILCSGHTGISIIDSVGTGSISGFLAAEVFFGTSAGKVAGLHLGGPARGVWIAGSSGSTKVL